MDDQDVRNPSLIKVFNNSRSSRADIHSWCGSAIPKLGIVGASVARVAPGEGDHGPKPGERSERPRGAVIFRVRIITVARSASVEVNRVLEAVRDRIRGIRINWGRDLGGGRGPDGCGSE